MPSNKTHKYALMKLKRIRHNYFSHESRVRLATVDSRFWFWNEKAEKPAFDCDDDSGLRRLGNSRNAVYA